MAAGDHGGPGPDLYQLLGVPRGASREEIAQAWRRRARAEHPDHRPRDAGDVATDRFRVLAEAWRVLSDPARRAAYDRTLEHQQADPRITAPTARVTARRPADPGRLGAMTPMARASGPPLRAGPVRVEGPYPASAAGGWDEEEIRLAVLARLVLRYLARDRDWPW
jgi:curved DNA-binding protein CbpA